MTVHHLGPTKVPLQQPDWWLPWGNKIVVVSKDRQNQLTGVGDLVLNNGVIAKAVVNRVERRPRFTFDWRVEHSGGLDTPYTGGRIEMSANELDQALGLNDVMDDPSDMLWMFAKYGGTVAVPGKYLRWGRYLNIPGPGTGHVGDANLSMYITDEIRDATKVLLKQVAIKM